MRQLPAPPQQLEYAPDSKDLRRRRMKRRMWIVFTALFTIGIAVALTKRGWRQAQVLYWQRQCMNATVPPDKVVWTSLPQSLGYSDLRWFRFCELSSAYAGYLETLFLHERISPAGHRRLVAVINNSGNRFVLWGVVFVPATTLRAPSEVLEDQIDNVSVPYFDPQKPLTVYAGQADPADASHFSIRVIVDGKEQFIDGWLRDDDRLILELRRTPSSAESP